MAYEKNRASFDWLAVWILFSAWASLTGWTLSVLGYLNLTGIIVCYLAFFVVLICFRSLLQIDSGRTAWRVFRSRYLVPKIWIFLAGLALAGGIAYSPNNYDYLTYRFPRVLYWCWEQGWRWIPSANQRMNYSGTGFEWLMVPLFIVFKTDRLFFLINFFSYLLLPGLVFSVFSSLGISKRICWWWMWVLPCGYCYILQAASVGNDSLAATYFLASLHYLYRAKASPSAKNLPLSLLAIALMSGAKASNLPLILPWLVLLFIQRKYIFQRSRYAVLATALVVAAAASFLPLGIMNSHYTGDYTGDPHNLNRMKLSNPVSGVEGNVFQFAKDNFAPPLWPWPMNWGNLLPAQTKANLKHDFPLMELYTGELPVEEEAGVGLGISVLAILLIVMGIQARIMSPRLIVLRDTPGLVLTGSVVAAWIVYMAKLGNPAESRLIAAYYPLLLANILVLVSLDGRIVRRRLFQGFALAAMLSAIPLVILSPARPLFPVQILSNIMAKMSLPPKMLGRYDVVYNVYSSRSNAYRSITATIPPDERVIGFLQVGDNPEASLWRPYGTRKVVDVTPDNSLRELKAQGIHFVVVGGDALVGRHHMSIASLQADWSASLVTQQILILKVQRGPELWYVLSL